MAGAGFKTFTTGEVLLAADVNTYLMQQTVMVFDDASARATAIPSPSEGMFSYLKDTNLTYRYDGSAWLSDAGTTSPLTTKGDVWGYSTTDARIPVGANGTVLTADSAEALGVKWAAASSGITWENWTPTYNASIDGNATVTARKAKSGNSAFFYFNFVYGSTSNFSASAYPAIALPYTSANYRNIFYGYAIDVSAGDSFQILFEQGSSDQNMYPSASNAAGTYLKTTGAGLNIQSSIPFTWASGDVLQVIGQYEAA